MLVSIPPPTPPPAATLPRSCPLACPTCLTCRTWYASEALLLQEAVGGAYHARARKALVSRERLCDNPGTLRQGVRPRKTLYHAHPQLCSKNVRMRALACVQVRQGRGRRYQKKRWSVLGARAWSASSPQSLLRTPLAAKTTQRKRATSPSSPPRHAPWRRWSRKRSEGGGLGARLC